MMDNSRRSLYRLVSSFGSFASILSLFLTISIPSQPLSGLQLLLIGVGSVLFTAFLALEVHAFLTPRPKSFSSDREIRDYMYKWIARGGRVLIFSRDLTWVSDDEMKSLLRSKAGRGELGICVPLRIPLLDDLEKEGARVYTYAELGYVPESRFTIINEGRMDAHVAIGRLVDGKHVIEEHSKGRHPTYSVAADLAEVVVRLSEVSRAGTASGVDSRRPA